MAGSDDEGTAESGRVVQGIQNFLRGRSHDTVLSALALLALLPFLLSWLSLTDRLPVAPATLHALANYGWLGLPLLCGVLGVWRGNLPAIALGALLLLVQPLTLAGNDVAALLPILGFIFCFLLYIELAYDQLRYARLARIMHHRADRRRLRLPRGAGRGAAGPLPQFYRVQHYLRPRALGDDFLRTVGYRADHLLAAVSGAAGGVGRCIVIFAQR